jgi:hypothetical protein
MEEADGMVCQARRKVTDKKYAMGEITRNMWAFCQFFPDCLMIGGSIAAEWRPQGAVEIIVGVVPTSTMDLAW